MSGSAARPRWARALDQPGLRPVAQPGANGIELDVAEADIEAPLVERDRAEAALPEGAAPALALVDLQGVAAVRLAERGGEAAGARRNEQQVDVVRHQAPGPDRRPRLRAAAAEQSEVSGARHRGEILAEDPRCQAPR